MPRLPIPGSDDGTWGAVLNEFLSVAHAADGTLLPGSVGTDQLADGSVTMPKLLTNSGPAPNQLLAYDGSSLTWVSRTAAGDPQLGGDLSGTASAAHLEDATVGSGQIIDNSISDIKIAPNAAIAQTKIANLTDDLSSKADAAALDGKVDTSRQISTTGSLTGGGALTADLTVRLVNDQNTPGASKYYGTNSGGTKGYYDLPSGGGAVNVSDLSDVSITALQQGQVLKYDGVNWVNDTDATGGGGANTFDKFTDGTNVATADSSTDTFKFRSSDGSIATVVTNDDLTHGDNVNLTVASNGVSNAQLAKAAATTIKGNSSGSLGNVSDLSVATVASMLPTFTTSSKGVVPVAPTGSTNYLRSDGTWAVPAGTITTGANAGLTGVSVLKGNSGNSIQLKSISAGSTAVSVVDDTANGAIKLDVAPANFAANSIPQSAINNLSNTFGTKQPLNANLTAIAALAPANNDILQYKTGSSAWVNTPFAQFKSDLSLTKSDVQLGNVDNTSDVNKPLSQATIDALVLKVSTDKVGVANGVASLDSTGKVPVVQLPSYVDQVQEFANSAAFPATGSTSVIYVDTSTNKTYRWSGTQYVQINSSPGTTTDVTEGSNLYFTNTRAQDAVGGAVANTSTVNLSYNGTTHAFTADAKTQLSVTSDASGIKLQGDAATPGASKYYGTNSSGTKGYYTLTAGETNTASNTGTGVGVYASKSAADLRFKSLAAGTAANGTASVQLTDNTAAGTVDLEVKPNTSKQKIEVASNGTVVGTRKQVNFKTSGTNISLTVQDNSTNDGVDVTIAGPPNADATNAGVIRLAGDLNGSTSYATPTIGANKVDNTKLAQMGTMTLKGNATGATANASDLSATTVTSMLNTFGASGTNHAKGLVPDPGTTAGTTKYLREDGTWAAPIQGTLTWGTAAPSGGADGDLYFQLA